MAIFENNRATGNQGGGFRTTSPFSRFSGNVAENNFGPGFVDDSANGDFEKMMKLLLSSGMSPDSVAEVREKTGEVIEAARSGDVAKAKFSHDRVVELTAAYVTIAQPLLSALSNYI